MEISELKARLNASIEFLKGELAQIRTGRVSSSVLDSIKVNVYGSLMSIKELGTISTLDPQTLQISLWDRSIVEVVSKAIRESELNLNPAVKNDVLIIPIPPLTEERRKEFAKLAATKVEEAKNAMRNIRQDAMKAIDNAFANKEFGEDDKFMKKEKVEETVKEFTTAAEALGEDKKTELLNI